MRNSDPQPISPPDPSVVATLDGEWSALHIKLADDPWTLTHPERLDLRANLGEEQVMWLRRIEGLVEPPAVDDAFPAFLLATRPFAHLAEAVGDAKSRTDLDTGTADALQRFVDLYRTFLTAE